MKLATLAVAFAVPICMAVACASTHVDEGRTFGALQVVIDAGVNAADVAVKTGTLPAATDIKIANAEIAIQKALPPLRQAYATSDSTFPSQAAAMGRLLIDLYNAYGATPPPAVTSLATSH